MDKSFSIGKFDQFDDDTGVDEQGSDLPDEIKELVETLRLNRLARIDALGKEVIRKREEAITGRRECGIEEVWQEDDEYYLGIDDANRTNSAWLKGAGVNGGISRETKADSSRCSAFFNITGQFCDSASSRMGDILLPAGDWNFTIRPTPVDDDSSDIPGSTPNNPNEPVDPTQSAPTDAAAAPAPAAQPAPAPEANPAQAPPPGLIGSSAATPAAAGQSPAPQQPAAPPPPPPEDPAKAKVEAIEATTEKAETRIKDWLVACSYHAEVRKTIEDCVRLGTGVLKGPVPIKTKALMIKTNPQTGEKEVTYEERISPGSKRIDPWDFYPDPACGDNIHNGNYVIEHDLITAKQLREFKGMPGYLDEMIDKVLDEGPGMKFITDGERDPEGETSDDDRFEVWYFYGNVDIDALQAFDAGEPSAVSSEKDETVPAIVTIVNDTPIKAFLNPLDTGGFPYDMIPWQAMSGSPYGQGISRKGRVPQDMLNASARALMDNGGLSSGPMLIIRPSAIRPADGDWTLKSRKVWISTEQADTRSVGDAIMAVNIPSVQQELAANIQLSYKMMEDATSMAYLMQGQQGSAPDTVGGMELLNRNASAVLRRMARTFDERITEPHIKRYYAWLLQYGEDDEKADLVIEAVGSSALVEREIQAMETQQLLQASGNPIYGLDPKKTMTELLKIKRMSPDKFQYSEADIEKQQHAQPAVAPNVQVAQINAQSAQAIAQAKIESDEKIAQLEAEVAHFRSQITAATATHGINVKQSLDAEAQRAVQQRDTADYQQKMQEMQLNERLQILLYANTHNITLEKLKAQLAMKSQELGVQKELSFASMNLDAQHHTEDIQLDAQQHQDNLELEATKHASALAQDSEKHFSALRQDTHKHMTQLEDDKVLASVPVSGRAPNGQAFGR